MISAVAAAALCVICIVAVDGPLALAVSAVSPDVQETIRTATRASEVVFGFRISPYLYGLLLVAAGLIGLVRAKGRMLPWSLLFVGLSHITARLLTGILKTPFSRLRPFEALGPDGWRDVWFAPVGNSFPSGHAVHFWSLFFPLAVLFPRYRAVLIVLPVLISIARVTVNDHYASDVIASCAVAAAVTWGFAECVLERGRRASR